MPTFERSAVRKQSRFLHTAQLSNRLTSPLGTVQGKNYTEKTLAVHPRRLDPRSRSLLTSSNPSTLGAERLVGGSLILPIP